MSVWLEVGDGPVVVLSAWVREHTSTRAQKLPLLERDCCADDGRCLSWRPWERFRPTRRVRAGDVARSIDDTRRRRRLLNGGGRRGELRARPFVSGTIASLFRSAHGTSRRRPSPKTLSEFPLVIQRGNVEIPAVGLNTVTYVRDARPYY